MAEKEKHAGGACAREVMYGVTYIHYVKYIFSWHLRCISVGGIKYLCVYG